MIYIVMVFVTMIGGFIISDAMFDNDLFPFPNSLYIVTLAYLWPIGIPLILFMMHQKRSGQ